MEKIRARLRVEIVYWYQKTTWGIVNHHARLGRMWGSDALRLQLRDFMAPHLPDNIDLRFSGLPIDSGRARKPIFHAWLRTRKPAIFILLKHVANRIRPDELADLREKAIAIGVDHKDNDLASANLLGYDFHVSSSESGRRAIEAILDEADLNERERPFVAVLPQSYDRLLAGLIPEASDRLAAIYLGDSRYAAIPAGLSAEIAMIEVERRADMVRAASSLGKFNFHYGVRPDPPPGPRRMYKPFTKGVTAAACHSNIIVNRQVDDAVDFLGEDYPYLVASNAPSDVEECFRKAKEEFGGPEWLRGLEIMRSVRDRVSGPVQARQFAEIVTRAAERGSMALRPTPWNGPATGSPQRSAVRPTEFAK